MGFLDQMGAAVGVGAAQVQVGLSTPRQAWAEHVAGAIFITGGKLPQPVEWIHARIVEHWVTSGNQGRQNHHYRRYGEVALAGAFQIEPGQQFRVDFAIPVPWGADFIHEWWVEGQASIPGARDARGRCDFQIAPPRPFEELAAVLSEVSSMPVTGWELHREVGAAAALTPQTPEIRRFVDGIRLEMLWNNGWITGDVAVNPQERGMGDVLKSFVASDLRYAFQVAAGDREAARSQFHSIVAQHYR